MGLEVERDERRQPARAAARPRRADVLLCAHLDTVPPAAPDRAGAGRRRLGERQRRHPRRRQQVGGGDDPRASRAAAASRARRSGSSCCSPSPRRSGCSGAKRFDASQLRAEFGYVFDHATPIGEIVTASPTLYRIEAEFHGKSAHAGLRPEDGRSAILAAAHAAIAMPHGRIDEQTTANLGYLHGGVESTNVVPERARVLAEVRSVDADKAEEVLAAMIDALHDGASHGECDVDVITEKQVVGYRAKPSSPAVVAAEAALRAHGYEPERIATGGASDANVFEAAGIPTRQRRQRHRAQPRADRARLGRRAGLDARRRVHPPRRGGDGMSSDFERIAPRRSSTASSSPSGATRFRHEDGAEVHARVRQPPGRGRHRRPRRRGAALARPPAARGRRLPGPARDPRRQARRGGRGPARGGQARARRGDRQAGRPLGVARRLLHLAPASPTRSSTSSSPPASPTSTSAPRSRRTSASRSSPPARRPRRDPRRDEGRQDPDRALPPQGPPPRAPDRSARRARAVAHDRDIRADAKVASDGRHRRSHSSRPHR